MRVIKSYLKFFVKVQVVARIRAFLLFVFDRHDAVTAVSSHRVLFIDLEAIGDLVVFTSVLQHYRRAFPEKELSLLIKQGLGLEQPLGAFVDHVVTVDYKRFAKNPWYGFRFVQHLRSLGFETVINHDHAVAEILGKMIAVELKAPRAICYEGVALQFRMPLDVNMKANVDYIATHLYPRYAELIPSLDMQDASGAPLRNVIEHYAHIYETVTKRKERAYATTLSVDAAERVRVRQILHANDISNKHYAVLNLGSSQAWKNWPVERFVAAAEVFAQNGIPVVLVGAPREAKLGEAFRTLFLGTCVDLTGQLSVLQTIALIADAYVVLTNDTASMHIAVALKVPALCVIGGGQFGQISLYGYSDINIWAYKRCECFYDNWRCTLGLAGGRVAPCIDAVSSEDVRVRLEGLLRYLREHPGYPHVSFAVSFL